MLIPSERIAIRHALRCLLAALMTLVTIPPALADDAGDLGRLVRAIFGDAPSQAAPSPSEAAPTATPFVIQRRRGPDLLVTLRAAQRVSMPKKRVAAVKIVRESPHKRSVQPDVLSDPTLRRGDAVMMSDGLRVFTGDNALPHSRTSFVEAAAAKAICGDETSMLVKIDRASRT